MQHAPVSSALPAAAGLTRRSFVAGSAAAALAGAALVSAASADAAEPAPASADGDADAAEPAAVGSPDRTLNPQDDSYTACTTDFSALFQPLQIGGATMPNRIAKSAAGSELLMMAKAEIPAAAWDFYENMAKGGVGWIWVEASDITPDASAFGKPMGRDIDVEYWKPLVDAIHSHGGCCGAQVAGNFFTMASSKTLESATDQNSNPPSVLTTEGVKEFQQDFINVAENIQKMGFDGIELNASCSHTFISFLSRFWNTERDDQYGPQSLENRARIVTEIIEGIRERCGADFVIQVLYSPIEENLISLGDNDLCTTIEEGVAFAKLFEAAGADALHIRSSLYGNHAPGFMVDLMNVPVPGHTSFGTVADFNRHMSGMWDGQWDGAAALLDVAARVKQNVSIPVGVVGCADPRLAPDLINDAIADGKIDFVLMTRALLCDPELPNKLREGRRDEVAPCAHCLTCFDRTLDGSRDLYCRVNAAMTRAYTEEMPEGYEPQPAPESKRVMVVGGGPAGMEAARVAAQRGHRVTLYEKSGMLGGAMTFAAAVKGPHEKIADQRAYLERQLELTGVEVVCGTEVDAAFVAEQAPEAVVVATGARRVMPDVPGADLPQVVSIENYLGAELGEKVVVLGANLQAVDFAIMLLKQGKQVVMVHEGSEADIDPIRPLYPRVSYLAWMRAVGTKIYNQTRLVQITEEGVTLETSYGTTVQVAADSVVSCIDELPDASLADAIAAELGDACQVVVVGDAQEPSTICHAIATGNVAARRIAPCDAVYDPANLMSGVDGEGGMPLPAAE